MTRPAAAVAAAVIAIAAGCTRAPAPEPNPLCPKRVPTTETPPPVGPLPPAIARVATQVQLVRDLRFKRVVVPEPISRGEMARELRVSLRRDFPADQTSRQGRAWTTIGAIPPGTDLRAAEIEFGASQIVGFYDSSSKRLVFQGGGASPTPYARFVLAHELTHALQDQNFDLTRLDRLSASCQDERAEAFLSLAEGDALETQVRWARQDLSVDEIAQIQQEAESFPPPPASTPRFVQQLFQFPYPNGQAFVEALLSRGGEEAVDEAFRRPPVSTEQVLHPDRYPGDVPQAVRIPDLSSSLGTGWGLLHQEDVGEGWLLTLLELRLPARDSEAAAAGWDGGLMRAWSKGTETAVLIRTAWDTERDAEQFGRAMQEWFQDQPALVERSGSSVSVLFGSDRSALEDLRSVAGG